MSIQEAVVTVLTKKYATFSGRARRSEYWWYSLALGIAMTVIQVVALAIDLPILYVVAALAVFIPGLALSVRRLHDVGRSGWWLLLILTLIGGFVLLYWAIQEGEPGDNQYGPSPKSAAELNPAPSASWGQS